MEKYAYCTLAVIGFTCWFSYLGFRDPGFTTKYVFWPQAILGWRQYYRLASSGFLHLNGRHLLLNMISLYFFGPMIERFCGPSEFLVVYLGAIVGGNLLALYVHRHHDYRALGASGGVAGIIFSYCLMFPGGGVGMIFIPIFVPPWVYAIAYLAYSFFGMQRGLGNVGHDAHLGGSLVGLYLTAAFHPNAVRYNPWMFSAISAGSVLLFIYMAKNPLFLPLEGFDFTKAKAQHAAKRGGFSLRWLFQSGRGKDGPAPDAPVRPEKRVDAILQKISEQGIQSLTAEEKKLLDAVSDTYRRRASREKPSSGFPF